jgi:Pyruvate/2-oxoacid:ferredoxin oxidoreductase delta subunit
MKRKTRSITIKPGQTTAGQANMWNMMRVMAGQDELPQCETCLGLPPDSDGPSMGKCKCAKP